jgi:thiamine pyrophosphate-dependent acetolactate synthase large subunit-like protein
MMAATVSDFMLERLGEWGVERIYGYPGDGINGILGALSPAEERFDFIQVPHEEVAAFMACAHAKFTGRPGVCMATLGPGAIHLLNGLYDARLDHALAAKFNYPERVAIALVGDGAMQMLGNNCLITAAKYWQRWRDPRLIVLVLNNEDLNQVTWEQRVLSGDPKWETSQNIMDFPYAAYAELIGLRGLRVEKPGRGGSGLGRGAARGSAVCARRQDRSQGAAVALTRHLRSGQELRPGLAQGRPRSATAGCSCEQ